MKRIQNWIAALVFVATMGGGVFAIATPTNVSAACNEGLLTFPAWYRGLTDDNCNIQGPDSAGGISAFIWKIVLNVIEIGLQLVGYISVAFIIFGGFKYMTANGESGEIAKAKNTIKNAIIGLLISLFSVAVVSFVAGAIS